MISVETDYLQRTLSTLKPSLGATVSVRVIPSSVWFSTLITRDPCTCSLVGSDVNACLLNFQGSSDGKLIDMIGLKPLQNHQWDWDMISLSPSPPGTIRISSANMPRKEEAHKWRLLDDPIWGLEGNNSRRTNRRSYMHTYRLYQLWRRGQMRASEMNYQIKRMIDHLLRLFHIYSSQ